MVYYKNDPVLISDIFCKKYLNVAANIEKVRLLRGKDIPDWPHWCFLPIKYWMLLFMDKPDISFTHELWQELQKFSVPGAWRYSKGIYTLHRLLLNTLTDTPLSEAPLWISFCAIPEWCIYVRPPGMHIDSECQPGTYPTRPKLMKTNKGFRLLPANGLGTGLSVRIRSGIR